MIEEQRFIVDAPSRDGNLPYMCCKDEGMLLHSTNGVENCLRKHWNVELQHVWYLPPFPGTRLSGRDLEGFVGTTTINSTPFTTEKRIQRMRGREYVCVRVCVHRVVESAQPVLHSPLPSLSRRVTSLVPSISSLLKAILFHTRNCNA